MIVKHKIGTCSNCGTNSELNFGMEEFDQTKHDLKNYLAYKDIYVYKCPKCGFISSDITGGDYRLFQKAKELQDFYDILSYDYLEGLNEEFLENHSETLPANLYDAYSFMQGFGDNTELFLRATNKAIEDKIEVVRRYETEVFEDGEDLADEEDVENLKNLEELMLENVMAQASGFIKTYKNFTHKNLFLDLMYVQNLIYLDELDEAKKQFRRLQSDYRIDDSLLEYFNTLMRRG